MPLDQDNPIPPLQSSTIQACLTAIVINVANLAAIITGKTYHVDAILDSITAGAPALASLLSMYFALRAIQGRMKATATIATKTNPNV